MRILYVNHTSTVSGAERSLLTLLGALSSEVSAAVACPEGPLARAVEQLGVDFEPIPGTAGSLKLHPLHTSRALAEIGAAAVVVRRVARRVGADIAHANSIRAGMVSVLARRLGGPPAVVHVRDCLPPSAATRAVRRLIGRDAAVVVSNSRYTEECFAEPGFRAASRVVYNAVDLGRFDPARIDRGEARARLGVRDATCLLALVAQLTPWKAQDDAVRIVHRLRERGRDVQLLLVGSAKFTSAATRYDNPAYVSSLEDLIGELGLRHQITFLGEREDVPEILRAADVLIAPSWEEPFGRSVIEGMAMGLPVAATEVGGPREILAHGKDGLLLPPRDPGRWADELEPLIEDRGLREGMGRAAQQKAEREFPPERHAETLVSIYREALAATRPRRGAAAPRRS